MVEVADSMCTALAFLPGSGRVRTRTSSSATPTPNTGPAFSTLLANVLVASAEVIVPHVVGISYDRAFEVHDLITDTTYVWHGPHNYVRLDPHDEPAHIFRIQA